MLNTLSSVAITVGRFIIAGLKSGITLKFTVTTAISSPGRCTAFTLLVLGGQSRSDAFSVRSTDLTVTCRPLTVFGGPCAASAADAIVSAIAPADKMRFVIIGAPSEREPLGERPSA